MAGPLRVLDLFSGIGGFSLGLERAGMKTVAFCEIDPFCRRVLAKHWPDVPCHEDITKLRGSDVGSVDVVCGGFPCTNISSAGDKSGVDGPDSGLWREFVRMVGELRPRFAIMENSADLLHRGIDRILGCLAGLRYDAGWVNLPARAIGATHERPRLWLVAYPNPGHGATWVDIYEELQREIWQARDRNRAEVWQQAADRLARVDHGFSDFLDRRQRTEALGNAVVPQIPELIGRAILEVEGRA